VIRQPFERGDRMPFWAGLRPPHGSYLFDTEVDPREEENRAGGREEGAMTDALFLELQRISAPGDLLERIGIG
jgi:hypothetical protein